jgi:hypothetical protein
VSSGSSASASHTWGSAGTYYVRAKAQDANGAESGWSASLAVAISVNNPPNAPSTPSGPTSGRVGTSYAYFTSATDPDGHQVRYCFDWGDGKSSWTDFVGSGATASASHAWTSAGTYYVRAKTQDLYGAESGWSEAITVTISNDPPNIPSIPFGPTSGITNVSYTYSTSTTDPDGHQVKYCFDWGDGTSSWTDFVNSGSNASASHSWLSPGIYYIEVKAQDAYGAESGWSEVFAVAIRAPETISLSPSADAYVEQQGGAGYNSGDLLVGVYETGPEQGDIAAWRSLLKFAIDLPTVLRSYPQSYGYIVPRAPRTFRCTSRPRRCGASPP